MNKIVKLSPHGDRADIFIAGHIGEGGTTAKQLETGLQKLGRVKTLNVYLDCIGGSFDMGMEMYMMLRVDSANVVANIQGEASSMASIVALAADEINIAANSWIMLHNVTGEAGVDEANKQMLDVYKRNTGLSREDLTDMLACETWLDAGQALDAGFADFITAPVQFDNENDYMKHRTSHNSLAAKYPSFAGAKARRKTIALKNEMFRCSNVAKDLLAQREFNQLKGRTQ